MNKLKILLADDHPLIRHGLKTIIETLGLANEILEADDGRQALALSHQNQIDLFILDYRMPHMGGYDTAKVLLNKNPKTKIVIVTAYSETKLISDVLDLGVLGFLLKNTDLEEIHYALNKVLSGQVYMNKTLEERILRERSYSNSCSSQLNFTKRENELITLLSKGKTSKEISQSLGVTQKTIETYRSRLLEKAGVKNSIELIDYVHTNGLV